MWFEIKRVSNFKRDAPPPVPSAIKISNILHDGSIYYEWQVNINTLEELIALREEAGDSLIVDDGQIWIYDDYME